MILDEIEKMQKSTITMDFEELFACDYEVFKSLRGERIPDTRWVKFLRRIGFNMPIRYDTSKLPPIYSRPMRVPFSVVQK